MCMDILEVDWLGHRLACDGAMRINELKHMCVGCLVTDKITQMSTLSVIPLEVVSYLRETDLKQQSFSTGCLVINFTQKKLNFSGFF